jgi:hypothetical protein
MANVYSIDSENLSSFGSVTTRDLDPFGSSTNQSLGLFGGADISALYPYYLTLNPESYTASDFARVTLNKGISGSDFVTQVDSIFVRSDFRRAFNDIQVVLEESTFNLSKKVFDNIVSLSFTTLNLDKLLVDASAIDDRNYLDLQKPLNDFVNNTFDKVKSLSFNKGLFDYQSSFDQIQSFNITKLLQDFANPVDLVNIPDGSTFQLNKTLRNTVDNIVDEISSFNIDKKLENDNAYGLDQTALHPHKPFANDQHLNDYSYFSLIKALFDKQVISDVTIFVVGKSLLDNQSIDDTTYLALDKQSYDLVDNVEDILQRIDFGKFITDLQLVNDTIQSFDVEKLLQDYANPLDLVAIPDGSTFQLNKTLRNTILLSDLASLVWYFNRSFDDISYIDDNSILAFTKALSDNQFLSDRIQAFSINKLLQEEPIATDVTSFDIDKVLDTEFALIEERKYLSFNKAVIDYSSQIDAITSVNIGKGLFEYQSPFDQIQSFVFNKVLEDYANPVDLVNIPDGSTFQLNKTLRNTVLPSDLASLVWYFNRSFDDSISNISDLITYIALGKTPFDEQFVNDDLQSLRLDKPVSELVTNTDLYSITLNKSITESLNSVDFTQLSFTKTVNDYVNQLDQLQYLNVEKLLSDDGYANDIIQSFTVTKFLQDFANPIDLVNIPDGSTFQLNKTLRNTILLSDVASLVWYFNRSFDDVLTISDYSSFNIVKSVNDEIAILDFYSLLYHKSIGDIGVISDASLIDLNKILIDTQVTNDQTALTVNKPVYEIANLSDFKTITLVKLVSDLVENINDNQTLSFNKNINDYEYAFDNVQSFNITKLLQDFANPIDFVGIPDGSTFQFNKTLRNTILLSDTFNKYVNYNRIYDDVLNTSNDSQIINFNKNVSDIGNINDSETKHLVKSLSFTSVINDALTSINVSKLIEDFANPIDLIAIPDGSTFQLDKTLRNTILLNDKFNISSLIKPFSELVVYTDVIKTTSNYNRTFSDVIFTSDNITTAGDGNDYTSNQGDLSNIEDSGYLFMTDYADITYFAEDYVGESRTFT